MDTGESSTHFIVFISMSAMWNFSVSHSIKAFSGGEDKHVSKIIHYTAWGYCIEDSFERKLHAH